MSLILLITFATCLIFISAILLFPGHITQLAIKIERKRSGLTARKIFLKDGTHFNYLEGGGGEPLVLLHGFGGDKDNFVRVSYFLKNNYHLIIPDLIDFKESNKKNGVDFSPAVQAKRLGLFLEALEINKVHLAGNSMGGQIALLFCINEKEVVQSLWLLAPSGIWNCPQTEIIQKIRQTGHNSLIARNVDEYKNVMSLGMYRPPFIPRPMLNFLAQDRINNADLEKKIFEQLLKCSLDNEVKNIKAPTLIVFGKEDKILNLKIGIFLNNSLVKSQLILMPKVAHVAMFEAPKKCAKDYITFRNKYFH